MTKSFADFYGTNGAFDATGALDPILNVDTRLFIDPALLRTTTVLEFKDSYTTVTEHFAKGS